MPIKSNDDIAHLLEATGRAGSSYREFENPSDQMSAPLIDAVFASAPPGPAPDERRPLGGGPTKSDLLSEVFDRPAPRSQAEPGRPVAAPSPATEAEVAPRQPSPRSSAPPAPPGRSLSDIRRIITQPSEEATKAPTSDSLHGLFDRLAG